MSFSNLKRQSGNLDKLTKAIEKLNTSESGGSDDNYWKCETDKGGNGMATIRFLPTPEIDGDEGLPWVKMYSHGFQGPGGWFIENCLTTKNQECCVCKLNSEAWNSGIEANKDVARSRKRRLNYISNIYVIDDPKHPENNGKVFLYRYGKKIFEKISEAMNPAFPDEKPINPFDLWEGANFKLKIRKVDGYQNYDKSEFESSSPLHNDDSKLESIYNMEYSLLSLVADKEFKTAQELQTKLDRVLGLSGSTVKTTVERARELPKQKVEEESHQETNNDYDDDADLKYFESLIED